MFEREYRDLAHVPRWGILPVNKRQNVAEHSYFVTLYAAHICLALDIEWKIMRNTFLHCVEHDRSETYTSDIPGPVKRGVGKESIEAYVEREDKRRFSTPDGSHDKAAVAIRKLADLMDEFAYLAEEINMGNDKHATKAQNDIYGRLMLAAAKVGVLTNNDVLKKVIDPFLAECVKAKIMPTVEDSDVAMAAE